jgi:hypothetical protein
MEGCGGGNPLDCSGVGRAGGGVGADRPGADENGGGGGADGGTGVFLVKLDEGGGGGRAGGGGTPLGVLIEPLGFRPADPGMGGGRPSVGAGGAESLALFEAVVTRRLTILDVGRTCWRFWRFSDTLWGIGGAAPVGRHGAKNPGDGGCPLPTGVDMGAFPEPAMVVGRFGELIELVWRRPGTSTVETGRSVPVSIPPLVAHSFGIPAASMPHRPGAGPGGGANEGFSTLPVLFARPQEGAGGRSPPGTGGAPPMGPLLLLFEEVAAIPSEWYLSRTGDGGTAVICHCLLERFSFLD